MYKTSKKSFATFWQIASALVLCIFSLSIIDTGLLTKAPVDLDNLSGQYIVGLHTAHRSSKIYKRGSALPECPGTQCPLNPEFEDIDASWNVLNKPYPMLDEMIVKDGQDGLAYFRIETTIPVFATEKNSPIAFDVLGFNAEQWRFFVNGNEVATGSGELLDSAIAFKSPGGSPGTKMVLGLELAIGKFLAPGINPVSQPFLSTPNLAPLIRNSYRSSDRSIVVPVSYMFSVFALLAALACIFTPFYREIFYFSLALNFWNIRHLMANLIIPPISFLSADFVVIDACLKVGLYGSLIAFFAHYFRQQSKFTNAVKYVCIGVAAMCLIGAGTSSWPELPIGIVRSQNLLVSLVLLFGSVLATRTFLSVRKNPRAKFRAFISFIFGSYALFAGIAFAVRYTTTLLGIKNFEVLNSLAVRQVYGSWMVILCIGLGLAIALEWALVVKDRKNIMQRFGMVVDRRLVDEVALDLRLTSRKIERAVAMFVDLRSFTTICETQTPEAAVKALNSFLEVVTEAVQCHGGIVDKFVGDGVMALWGVPIPQDGAVLQAATAGVAIRNRIRELNSTRSENGEFALGYGIGLHIGSVIFGPVGTAERIDYTAIGPTVNVASRIQGLTKRFQCDILMSREFARCLPQDVEIETLGSVEVRGIRAQIEIFKISDTDQYLSKVASNPRGDADGKKRRVFARLDSKGKPSSQSISNSDSRAA